MRASLEYWYFDNLEDLNGIKNFHYVEAALKYNFTKNTALTLSYKEGRNVDTLEKIDLMENALTFKFGEFTEQ